MLREKLSNNTSFSDTSLESKNILKYMSQNTFTINF